MELMDKLEVVAMAEAEAEALVLALLTTLIRYKADREELVAEEEAEESTNLVQRLRTEEILSAEVAAGVEGHLTAPMP
jgi:hypothetical protein